MDSKTIGQRLIPPEELALQSLCKQLFKSRLFRGYYKERCYVPNVSDYRDIVVLQRGERELEKLLLDAKDKLQMFYHRIVPNMWVGISKGSAVDGSYKHIAGTGLLDTIIWAELSDLAFGEYWFSVKSLRFRDREIILKLKMVRAVENEPSAMPRQRRTIETSAADANFASTISTTIKPKGAGAEFTTTTEITEKAEDNHQPQIGLDDFKEVLEKWGNSIKQTTYEFMANDINKANILGFIKFFGLLIISILTGAVYAVRFLGIFTLRFMFEFSRFAHVVTPIIVKIIDTVNKIIGGFYILLAMIWKDTFVNRGVNKEQRAALDYQRQQFQSIDYNKAPPANVEQRSRLPIQSVEFDRKFQ